MTFDEYQEAALQTAIYPGSGTPIGLCYVALKMNGEAGEFAEHLGKALRDDSYGEYFDHDFTGQPIEPQAVELRDNRRELLIKEIGDVLWYLSAAAKELGITLEETAKINLEKLASRQSRGALCGSGDER